MKGLECRMCLMDSTASDFYSTETGCNYCDELRTLISTSNPISQRGDMLKNFIQKIKKRSKGSEYDCVVGVSGGIDSSFLLMKTVEWGLKPLAVHMDNTWNSELASTNIRNLINSLGVDLKTTVVDWTVYKQMMNAFFSSDVVDVELLYDNALYGVNYRTAKQMGIKTILGGHNIATEGIRIPNDWAWLKYDLTNIQSICAHFNVTKSKIEEYPGFGIKDYFKYKYIHRINWFNPLNFINYHKENALSELEKKCDYRRYPFKHYESIFTRFYQAVILPKKFSIDKRKPHLSGLIVTGQLSRNEAKDLLTASPYPDASQEQEDLRFFLDKMEWKHSDLESYVNRKQKSHLDYPNNANLYKFLINIKNLVER